MERAPTTGARESFRPHTEEFFIRGLGYNISVESPTTATLIIDGHRVTYEKTGTRTTISIEHVGGAAEAATVTTQHPVVRDLMMPIDTYLHHMQHGIPGYSQQYDDASFQKIVGTERRTIAAHAIPTAEDDPRLTEIIRRPNDPEGETMYDHGY